MPVYPKPTYPELLERYRKRHGKLIEPNQGFDSLHKSLWLAYSLGRVRGFTDLGTYVPKPLDHGGHPNPPPHPPAWAFDLGRENRFFNKGWNYVTARRLAKFYARNHLALNIEYVILGMRIWSRQRALEFTREEGWHPYEGDSSHLFHIHVSGHHG